MDKYLTPEELAKRWGLSIYTLLSWRKKGKGPKFIKLGKSIRYEKAEIEKMECKDESDT